jgi:predicted DNA-binding helix-hairpin-helix protein
MDRRHRVQILSETADREDGVAVRRPGDPVGVTAVRMPGGGTTNIMRVMQTNACSLACGYCPTFCGGKIKRTALTPEEVATTFIEAWRARIADGLFLTSGVPGRPERMTDRMLAAVEILRRREKFEGYVHLKLLPGSEPAQVEHAARLATRLSINLEGPDETTVRRLSKDKNLTGDLLPKLELAGRLSRASREDRGLAPLAPAGITTQFVVGAADDRDRDILGLVARLERQRLLHHAHFSSFQPVVGTPMENLPGVPAVRELRLYQAEHLLRGYGFRFDELVFGAHGNLDLDHDPKTAWALTHLAHFPVTVEKAPYELLVRVPGIGPKTARTLASARARTVLRGPEDLRRAGVDVQRAAYFLLLRGRRLASRPPAQQLRLFAHGHHLTQAPFRTPVPPCAYR